MSRPVGRYFASVIAKIHAYKEQESIVVDENLKTNLRAELLAKIQSGSFVQDSVAEKSTVTPVSIDEDETVGFFDRFFKWRYQVAIIPVFLLTVVAVAAFRRWPIDLSFRSNAPAPAAPVTNSQPVNPTPSFTPTSSSGENLSEGVEVTPSNVEDSQVSVESVAPSVSAIPEIIYPTSAPAPYVAYVPKKVTVPASVKPVVEKSKPVSSAAKSTPANNAASPSTNTSGSGGFSYTKPDSYQPPSSYTPTYQPSYSYTPSYPSSAPSSSSSASGVTAPASSTPSSSSSASGVTAPASSTPSSSSATGVTAPASSTPSSSSATGVTVPSSSYGVTIGSGTVKTYPNYYVYYQGVYTEAEKRLFENTLLPPLVKDKSVAYIAVRLDNAWTSVVTIVLTDKTVLTHRFRMSSITKTWVPDVPQPYPTGRK